MAETIIMSAVAAASSVGAGATAVAGAVGGWGSLLSLGLTAASAFSSIQAGETQGQIFKMQARQSDLSAEYEKLKGRSSALQIKQQLMADTASANALFTSRGMTAGEGSGRAVVDRGNANATSDLQIAQFGTDMGVEAAHGQSAQLRVSAKSARQAGWTGAFTTLASSKGVGSLFDSVLKGI